MDRLGQVSELSEITLKFQRVHTHVYLTKEWIHNFHQILNKPVSDPYKWRTLNQGSSGAVKKYFFEIFLLRSPSGMYQRVEIFYKEKVGTNKPFFVNILPSLTTQNESGEWRHRSIFHCKVFLQKEMYNLPPPRQVSWALKYLAVPSRVKNLA